MTNDINKPCVFFDRDGVINLSPGVGYVLSWDQFEFSPGIIDVLKWVKQQNWLIVLITSQRGVGKGLMSLSDLDEIHARMQQQLEQEAANFDAIYAYTETPDCKHQPKPNPEMLFTASTDLKIDLAKSWMIGDSDRDIEMGHVAGLKGCIRFISDKTPEIEAEHTVKNASSLKAQLEKLF